MILAPSSWLPHCYGPSEFPLYLESEQCKWVHLPTLLSVSLDFFWGTSRQIYPPVKSAYSARAGRVSGPLRHHLETQARRGWVEGELLLQLLNP